MDVMAEAQKAEEDAVRGSKEENGRVTKKETRHSPNSGTGFHSLAGAGRGKKMQDRLRAKQGKSNSSVYFLLMLFMNDCDVG